MTASSAGRHTCRVADLEWAAGDIRIVRLKVVDGRPLRFRAGQYARVFFDAFPPRDYSMANRPDEATLEFHVRHMKPHGVSEYVARKLRRGDAVAIEGPCGEAWLREDHDGPILAIAAGSGLAPIKSIVETALTRGMTQDIHLYFGGRVERDIYLEQHFNALSGAYRNLRFLPVLSGAAGSAGRRAGALEAVIGDDFGDFAGFKAYLAGPPAIVERVVERLLAHGMAATDIHADPFYTESDRAQGRVPGDR